MHDRVWVKDLSSYYAVLVLKNAPQFYKCQVNTFGFVSVTSLLVFLVLTLSFTQSLVFLIPCFYNSNSTFIPWLRTERSGTGDLGWLWSVPLDGAAERGES